MYRGVPYALALLERNFNDFHGNLESGRLSLPPLFLSVVVRVEGLVYADRLKLLVGRRMHSARGSGGAQVGGATLRTNPDISETSLTILGVLKHFHSPFLWLVRVFEHAVSISTRSSQERTQEIPGFFYKNLIFSKKSRKYLIFI